jgi:hypothetical protein
LAQEEIPTVSIRHLSTAYANGGICSIRFGVGTTMGEGDAGEVSITLKFTDSKGKKLYQGTIDASLNDSSAGRYQEVFLEDAGICFGSDTKVNVVQATSTVGKKKFNLVKLHKIVADDFRPYVISVPK